MKASKRFNHFKQKKMKRTIKSFIITVSCVLRATILLAQDIREVEIRRLENIEREATMKGDSVLLFGKIWSNGMIVNTPANRIGMVEGTKMQLRTGNLAYLSFVRNIEQITFNDNIALVMGEEITKPQGHQQNAGKTVTRRFTNIWKYHKKQWQMIGRQATIIKVE
jgi:Domain of unknown function (DUF4440)